MRHPHHGAFCNAWQVVQHVFNFSWIHIETAADDQVLAATHYAHITFVIQCAHVTRDEVAICGELLGIFFRHAPIPCKHIWSLDLNAADFTTRQGLARSGHDPQVHAWQSKTHAATDAFGGATKSWISAVRVRRQHDGFTHAITLQHGVTGSFFPLREGIDQHRCRTGNEQPHACTSGFVQPRQCQQTRIESRHPHQHGGTRHVCQHPCRVKPAVPTHLAAAEQRTVDCHKQAMHMKNGQRMNQHIANLPTPVVIQHTCIAQQIAMAQHRPFAAPRGATGVDDGGDVIGFAVNRCVQITVVRSALQQTACALVIQRDHIGRA